VNETSCTSSRPAAGTDDRRTDGVDPKEFRVKRSPLPVLMLVAGLAWTAGQALLPDMGLEWEPRLAAVAEARGAQALSTGLFVLAGILLVAAAITAAQARTAGRGARAITAGTLLLGIGGIWLAAGRGAFNMQMYRLTDPAVAPDTALDVAAADVGLGFVPLLLALPALLLGPVVLAVGARRAGLAGRLPWMALGCWVLGVATFMASEFTVKAGEVAGIAVATLGLTLLGAALTRPATGTPAAMPAGAPVAG
jgi:hypothetical protein